MKFDTKCWNVGSKIFLETNQEQRAGDLRGIYRNTLSNKIMDTEDKVVRQKLIEMGWTPPDSNKQSLADEIVSFTKENNLYVSYDGEKDYFIVLILDIDYRVDTLESLNKLKTMYKSHCELMIGY